MVPSLALLTLAACGSWRRVGTEEPGASPAERVPQLYDPTTVYRNMGLIAEGGALPYVGTIRVLAGPAPDSLLVVIGLSLRNRDFAFQRDGNQFVADYRVELTFRRDAGMAQQVVREERIRVATFRETQRTDESVIFQQFVPLPAGQYVLAIVVRDRNSPNSSRYEQLLIVPRLSPPALAQPVAVYQSRMRADRGAPPELILNPRSTVGFGADTLHFYTEGYGLRRGSRVIASAVDGAERVAWTDTVAARADSALQAIEIALPPGRLSVGRYELRLALDDSTAAIAPFLVAFSDQFAAANLDDIISLLRYFPGVDSLRGLAQVAPEQRAEAWQRFWRQSDPNPASPEHEALDEYFARLQRATELFRDEGMPGWLTDRGEVFIGLGEPDDVVDRRPDLGRGRVIYWTYTEHRLTLAFVDDAGFGRFRLDPRSRADFLRIVSRIRRS
jgi:GWxTD domain-containing protein